MTTDLYRLAMTAGRSGGITDGAAVVSGLVTRGVLMLGLVTLLAACSGEAATTTVSINDRRPVTTSPEVTTPTPPVVDPALAGDLGSGSLLFPGVGNGGYDVTLYDRTLDLTADLTAIDGLAVIKANTTQALQQFSLDARGLNVESVSVNGSDVLITSVEPELILTLDQPLPAGVEFEVVVNYTAEPEPYRAPGLLFDMGWDVEPWWRVFTHGFPGAESTWTPTNETYTETARYIHRVKAPPGLVVTSSGFPVDDPEYSVWDTRIEVPEATVVITEAEVTEFDWNGIPIDLSIGPEMHRVAETLERKVPEMLDWLETIYGPFPYERLGITSAFGLPFVESTPMRIVLPPDHDDTLLVHVLAHQWVGDSVATAELESTGWVYEALAAYTETLYREHQGVELDLIAAGLEAQVPEMTNPLDDVQFAGDLVNFGTYRRSILFIHAFRLEIGDEAFFDTLRELTETHRHDFGELTDLQAIAEEKSGLDLGAFVHSWIANRAVPELPGAEE